MEKIILEPSEAENVLRKWFEAGIAYNLILGTLKEREDRGIVRLGQTLDCIPLADRAFYDNILEKAFNPQKNALHEVMSSINFGDKFFDKLLVDIILLTNNYPNWSFQLLKEATKPSALEPKCMVQAYYLIRSELEKARTKKVSIEITDPTLIALSKLVNEQQLTSNLVDVEDGPAQGGNTPFIIHSYDLFTFNSTGERRPLGQIHSHFIDIAHKHELGIDPMEYVICPLLDGKTYNQWAPMLHALCRHYESSGATEYYKTYRDHVPRIHESELDSTSITPQFDRLRKRENALWQFLKPHPSYFAQIPKDPLEKIDPTLVQKMVLSHMIMFYLTTMNHRSWFIDIRQYLAQLKMRYPTNYLNMLTSWNYTQEEIDVSAPIRSILLKLKKSFDANPIGLFPWMFVSLPEPMELMKHYFLDKDHTNVGQIAQKNSLFKQLSLAKAALSIPKYLLKVDTSQWMKPAVMVQFPSNKLQACVFYAPETLSRERRLYLAGLLCKGQYLEETLKNNLIMEIKTLENLLLGICYLWHDIFIEKISVRKFLDTLQDYGLGDMSERTLKKRIDKAKYWLETWPDVTLFYEQE